ncbi:hypothetical protein B7494_g1857 [Chlorociboria aeruginascens]|nr:hypothetical protein B7494_g1857 [Chlorociboria aeruginascens]
MEVTGVVLGAVPLILYALDNYQRAWGPISDFKNWKDNIGTIRNNVFLQKRQLDVTLAHLGLEDPTMIEVEAALLVRCPDECERFIEIIKEMDALINQLRKNLDLDAQGQPMWTNAVSERVNWEWRRVKRSFGKKERKQIFDQLRDWNLALQNCGLEKREVSSDSENRIVNLIRGRFDEKKCRMIRANAQGIHKALISGFGCTCSYPHKGNIELNWHCNKIISATNFTVAFSARQDAQMQGGIVDPLWKNISIRIEEAAHLTQFMSQAAKDSAATLSPPPTKTPKVTFQEPLLKKKRFIQDFDGTIKHRLTRKQRFGIAAALAWAVLHLCDSPWLGKNLNEDDIQFFLEGQTGAASKCLSSNPYLSCSFSSPTTNTGSSYIAPISLTTTPSSPTDPPIASQSSKFGSNQIRNTMLFTFSIRLIELGLNRSFTQLRQEYTTPRSQPATNATVVGDFKIAEDQIRELYLDPGKIYANAADRCLKFLFPGPEDMNTFEHSSFRSTFFADVVAPIQATFDLIPGSCSPINL